MKLLIKFIKLKWMYALLCIIFINCDFGSENKRKANDFLTVFLELKTENEDVFEVYYAEDIRDSYKLNDKVKAGVKNQEDFQEIKFRLPNRIYPFKLRIDIGSSGQEDFIELSQIVLSTGLNSKVFSTAEIPLYFRANSYVEYGKGGKIYRNKIDGIYDPYLLSVDLTDIIVELFND